MHRCKPLFYNSNICRRTSSGSVLIVTVGGPTLPKSVTRAKERGITTLRESQAQVGTTSPQHQFRVRSSLVSVRFYFNVNESGYSPTLEIMSDKVVTCQLRARKSLDFRRAIWSLFVNGSSLTSGRPPSYACTSTFFTCSHTSHHRLYRRAFP
jgi:hypothetical protein